VVIRLDRVSVGHRVTPTNSNAIKIIARFISVVAFRAFMNSNLAETSGFWRYSDVPDEMLQLAKELKELVKKSGLPGPRDQKSTRAGLKKRNIRTANEARCPQTCAISSRFR
jgi:hypothetical protein